MIRRRFSLFLLIFFFHSSSLILATTSSHPTNNSDPRILQDVLKEIADRQNWDFDGINISKLEVGKVRFGTAQRYEFRIRLGKIYLVFNFPDQVDSWNKLRTSDGFGDLVTGGVASLPVLHTLKLQGPFDFLVGAQDQLSLSLPMNISHQGVKRVLVGEGITVEVTGAQGLSHIFNLNFGGVNASVINKGRARILPFWHSLCMPLLAVHISGSSSLVAYKNRNPDAKIETTYLAKDMIELLPEKCYDSNVQRVQGWPIHSLSQSIARLENFLKSFLGNRIRGLSGFLRANVKASTTVRFQLELERSMGRNETRQDAWRTRPTVERCWFDVTARIEAEKLKPLSVKKVRPFIPVDSASWSNLMSNISFTKFPSILVPPEALTLDVKW